MTGVLPSQTIEMMLERGEITVSTPLVEGQVQPASLDLRLGHVAHRVRASFLAGKGRRVADRLADLGVEGGADFWIAVRGNIAKLSEAGEWWLVVSAPIAPVIDDADREFCAAAADLHIYELSARIGELERDGWFFDRETITGTNQYGRRW